MGAMKKSFDKLRTKVYIIHGWSYSIEKWDELVTILKKKGIDAKVLKVPGLIYPIEKPWTINDYVSWLSRELKNEKEVVLVGHSNGGRIAMAFVKKHANKVLRLILIDSAGVYHNNLPIKIKRFLFGTSAKIGKNITSSERFKKILYKLARSNDYNKADLVMKKTMVNLIESDKSRNFESIKVPTAIIWGRDDTTTSLADGKLLNREIKGSKLIVIKNAKHSPQFSHPHEVTDIILRNL